MTCLDDHMEHFIYLDNAATTRCCDEAVEEMMPFFTEEYASPMAQYRAGFEVNSALNEARKRAASLIGAERDEIIFTSSGTESNNLFLRGAVMAIKRGLIARPGGHRVTPQDGKITVITDSAEHASMLRTCADITEEFDDVRVITVPVDREGYIDEGAFEKALFCGPSIVSIMHVNNETGIINDIEKYCRMAHEAGALFHTDAVQSVPHIGVNVKKLNVDAISVSGHKLHGPKGSGFLYVKNPLRLVPQLTGGGQEKGFRSGTPDTAACVGLGKACEVLRSCGYDCNSAKESAEAFCEGLSRLLPEAIINKPKKRGYVPEIVSVSIPDGDALSFLPDLDMAGICCSAGAACSSGKEGISHVLKAMGMEPVLAKGTLRFSFSRYNSPQEAEKAAAIVSSVITANMKNRGIR